MGFGAALTAAAFLMLTCYGLAGRGWCRGDAFVVGAIGSRRRAHHRVRVLSGHHHPGERVAEQ